MQIDIKGISYIYNPKTYGAHQALNAVSVNIKQGELIGIIGPTGSGKTTFIQHLNALLKPSSGEIIFTNLHNWENYKKRSKKLLISKYEHKMKKSKTRASQIKFKKILDRKKIKQQQLFQKLERTFANLPYSKRNRFLSKNKIINEKRITNKTKKIRNILNIRSKIGVVFQFAEYQLFEETIIKDIMFGPLNLGLSKSQAKQIAIKSLKTVGLPKSYLYKSPFELSGGEKRRVAIAGILAMEPDFLIFDEPTAGLDPVGCEQMIGIFKKLHKLGKTIIIVTHNLDHVLEITEKTMLFKSGKLLRFDDTYGILQDTKFLSENNMQPPKLLLFANKLKEYKINIGKIKTIDDITNEILAHKKGGK